MNYILTLFLIGLAILFHEFGHYLAALVVKIPIRTFSIGFGPKIWSRKIGSTEYRISLIPLGGYVLPDIEDEDDFFAINVNKRIIMSLGGPLASLILPVLCFLVLNLILSGFSFNSILVKPLLQLAKSFYTMLISLPLMFKDTANVSGIIGIVAQGGQILNHNFLNSFSFLGLLSTNFALLNLLPIPVLDGGKVLLYLLEKLTPRSIKLHIPLAVISWVLVLGLMIYITVLDVLKFLV